MRKSFTLLLALLLIASHSSLAFSQQGPSNEWGAVQKIQTNEDVVIKKKDGKQLKGGMIEASDTTLTIDRDGKPVHIPRADVHRVYIIAAKAQKGKWAWIGAGAGAGAGAGVGAIKYSDKVDDSELWIGMGLLIGTGVGAVTGMLLGQAKRKRVLVYTTD